MKEQNTMLIARNEFEEIGIRLVVNQTRFCRMKAAYDVCCTRCSLHGRNADCGACPIRESFLVAARLCKLTKEDNLYLELEESSVD